MNRMSIFVLIYVTFVIISGNTQEVTVEWNQVRQTIDGFGASDAWFSDEIMTHPNKDVLLDLLFKREGGIGLSILRHHIPPRIGDWSDYQMDLISGDLDFGTRPYCGVRFADVAIPPGATIDSVFIQFSAKDSQVQESFLTILGHAHDSAGPFMAETADISSRPAADDSVIWNPPAWTIGDSGPAQRTPDLSTIVQNIVNRPGWQSGNALVFIIKNLTGKRSAHSFDGNAGEAPQLTVYFSADQQLTISVNSSNDDAEENGLSYVTYGAEVTKEAFARDCELVWAAAWSPPQEWKTNNNLSQGGFLKQEHYQDWADRLEQYRVEMESRSGYTLYGISPQNEPGVKPWESCQWNKNDFRDFIKHNLGPTLDPACRIIVPEETNWNNVDDFYGPTYQDEIARGFTDIVAGHVYGGDPDVSYNFFGKPVWETEWSYDTSKDDLSINNGVTWAYNFWRLLVNAEVSACHHWWLINFKVDGRQQGLLSATPYVEEYTVPKRLWTVGNFSKFVRPGWLRIAATKNPQTDIYFSAFKDTLTNQFAIVAINKSSSDNAIRIDFEGFECAAVTPHRTSAAEDLAELKEVPGGDGYFAVVPAKSVTTFTGVATPVSSVQHMRTPSGGPPQHFNLAQNYPNPFNPSTTILIDIAEKSHVRLEVFDINGRLVHKLLDDQKSPGSYNVTWHAQDSRGNPLPSGVYLFRIIATGQTKYYTSTKKMILIK